MKDLADAAPDFAMAPGATIVASSTWLSRVVAAFSQGDHGGGHWAARASEES